jgi:transglutaminase-like putative cysteine protease
MRIRVHHETTYRYQAPLKYSVMILRLSPQSGAAQHVLDWKVEAPGRLAPFRDHHGNQALCLFLGEAHEEVTVIARGLVETVETHGVWPRAEDELPVGAYLRAGPHTGLDANLVAFAEGFRAEIEAARLEGLHRLARAVHETVTFEEGETEATTTAAEALAAGKGVCQDHAHIFLACCRHLGVSARYVSGYLAPAGDGAATHEAGHAWAEALVEDLGWVSFDAANGIAADEHYLRVAAGFDYADAGPLRGVRAGGGGENLIVQVRIQGQE